MINHLWQSTVFAIAAGLLTLAFRRNRAQVRYWLWFSASLKFFVPLALLINLGSHVQWTPAAREMAAPSVLAIEQVTEPFPQTVSFSPVTIAPARDWIPVALVFTLLGAWACGFSAIGLIRLRGWRRIRAAVRASAPFDIAAPVEIRSSPGLLEPGVVGMLRPILLVPAGIADCLTPHQLQALLVHELCHVRRRDNLTSAIHMIVEATFWFHPVIWRIGARLVEERERACDEEVLSLGSEPGVYAEAILNVCKLYVESPLACLSGVTGSDLKKRIEAIMTKRITLRLNFGKKVAIAVAGMAALALPNAGGSAGRSGNASCARSTSRACEAECYPEAVRCPEAGGPTPGFSRSGI
jgi:bla regulator protein BlaR1